METQEFRYDVFVSYRHKPMDTKVASRSARFLETYRLPARLTKHGYQGVRRVFRDTEELALSGVLSDTIAQALYSSRILLVLCSPDTPESEWVDREVATFIEQGRAEHIYALLIRGDAQSAFPPNLHRVADIGDRLLDVRAETEAEVLTKTKTALLQVIAHNAGCSAAELLRAHRMRRLRNTGLRYVGGIALLAVVGGVALSLWTVARQYRAQALADQAATMEMIETLTYTLPANLSGIPGTYSIVSVMLETNVAQINEILEASPNPDAIQREKAVNLGKLARVQAVLGDYAAAVESSRQAVALYKSLYDSTQSASALADYTSGLNNLGNRLSAQGLLAEADESFLSAISLQETIAAQSPHYEANLARYHHNRATNLMSMGQLQDAIDSESVGVGRMLALGDAAGDTRGDLVSMYQTLAACCNQLADYQTGAGYLQQALALAEGMYDENEGRASMERLANVYGAVATNADLSGNEAMAAEYYELAIARREVLAYDAENVEAQESLAIAYMNYGVSLNTYGHYEEAERYYQAALAIRQQQAAGASAVGQARRALVGYALAENALDAGQYEEAQAYYDEALAVYAPIAEGLGSYYAAEYLSMRAYYAIVFGGNLSNALEYSRQATTLMPQSSFANIIYGYALMYNDARDECLAVFKALAARGENEKLTIREDLHMLTEKGLAHPLMEDILALL